MYKVGEFSKITSLTVKTLRLYHEKSILVPSYIDPDTSYRYYSRADVQTAQTIKLLRTMRFSLSEIHDILMECLDDSDLRVVLTKRQAAIDQELGRLKRITASISTILNREKRALDMRKIELGVIEEKQIAPLLVLSLRWTGPYRDSGDAFGKLYKKAGRQADGHAMSLYHDAEYQEIADIESCIPLKKEISGGDLVVKELPAIRCLSIIHKGAYESIGQSYAALFDYAKQHGLVPVPPFRVVFVKGPGLVMKGDPNNYITEVQMPIAE